MNLRFDLLNRFGSIEGAESEADLRDAYAALAWLCGWEVATEYKAQDRSRADLVLWSKGSPILIVEVKPELRTPRQFRLGFQQADGYRRHFGDKWPGSLTYLVGHEIDHASARLADRVYPETTLLAGDEFMLMVRLGHTWAGQAEREATSMARYEEMQRRANLIEAITVERDEIRQAAEFVEGRS